MPFRALAPTRQSLLAATELIGLSRSRKCRQKLEFGVSHGLITSSRVLGTVFASMYVHNERYTISDLTRWVFLNAHDSSVSQPYEIREDRHESRCSHHPSHAAWTPFHWNRGRRPVDHRLGHHFSTFNPAWGKESDVLWVKVNKLVIQPEPNSTCSFTSELRSAMPISG